MPERQSTPGAPTAEQDAEAPADPASSSDEPTRPVRRGDAATVGLPRAVVPPATRDGAASAAAAEPAAQPTRPAPTSNGAPASAGAPGGAAFDNQPAGNAAGRSASGVDDPPTGRSPDGGPGPQPAGNPSAVNGQTGGIPAGEGPAPADTRPADGNPPAAPAPPRPTSAGPDSADTRPDGDPAAPTPGDVPAGPRPPSMAAGRPTAPPSADVPAGPRPSAPAPAENPDPSPPDDPADVTRPAESPIVVRRTPDAEKTQVIRLPEAATVQIAAHPEAPTVAQPIGTTTAQADAPTVAQPVPPPPDGPDADPEAATANPRRHRILLVVGGVVAALALLYGGDLALSQGSVPRGVTVAGVPVGGLSFADAEQTLRAQIGPRTTRPVPVTVGDATSTVDPVAAGLAVDWMATLAQAEHQPLDPVTRVASFFTTREVGVVTKADPAALEAALTELKPAFDKPAVEGNVRFDGLSPQPVEPVAGQELDVPAAAAALTRDWALGTPVALPLTRLEPTTTREDVATALEKVAKPAVSAPITVTGENGTSGTLAPQDIAAALTFRPDPAAGLAPELNVDAISKVLRPKLAASETPGRDASLDFTTGTPVVVPSLDGRGVDYPATLKALLPVLTAPAPRQVAAVYGDQPAKLTTEGLSKLGISGLIGEFTTRGFASDSGMNIKRAAEQINGTIVQPGGTFSLNAATNPRDAAHGYVEAGIIEDGHPARGIGGGVSQVATTLYNASYFAGMTNVEHKEHSFYISRYPAGREATVFDDVIDLKFRNDNPTAIMIQTVWAPGSITVRIYGTKRYDVTSATGPRTNPTEPKTVKIDDGEACSPSKGAPGFTVTDTRTLKEISTGQVRTETRTVRYNPSPVIECGDD
jgi:vancomycin resistance protein YoaR